MPHQPIKYARIESDLQLPLSGGIGTDAVISLSLHSSSLSITSFEQKKQVQAQLADSTSLIDILHLGVDVFGVFFFSS